MSPVFKIKKGKSSPEKELEFELKFQKSLSFAQRFRMMVHQSKLVLRMLVENGYRKPAEIIKRV